jgi:outer membrane biosynthesis protein TonB
VEVDAKVKELEDEVKVLKAEIRNVLLDIREAILENTNPLSEQEPAYLRMDLNTTARALAAEEAARAMRDAAEQPKGNEPTESEAEEPEAPEADVPPESPSEEETEEAGEEPTESELEETEEATGEEPEQATSEEPTESEAEESEATGDGELPANGKGSLEAALRRSRLPPMQLAYMLPTGAVGGLAAWVTEAMATIGPQDLERVITIHRLWGSLPPNISYALAHLQRLIRSSQKADPPWLKVMQDMEKLASS